MKLRVPDHDSDKFTWHSKIKEFASEASTLGNRFMDRVYDDACDMGFLMISSRTSKAIMFLLIGEDRSDNELTAWRFESQSGQYKAVVFND